MATSASGDRTAVAVEGISQRGKEASRRLSVVRETP
jgi:hypothetical protein